MSDPKFNQLARDYIYATDCNLATLSILVERKKTSKSDVSRQMNICLKMLTVCLDFEDTPLWLSNRITDIFKASKTCGGLDTALRQWTEKQASR